MRRMRRMRDGVDNGGIDDGAGLDDDIIIGVS
jgi:hypothetical protein